ncbi:hypothetical protein TorRG33x02_162800, partial [Trema orientale]
SQASSFALGSSATRARCEIPRIDEIAIADEVLSLKKRLRGVSRKPEVAASTTSTAAFPPQELAMLDANLQDFYSRAQN